MSTDSNDLAEHLASLDLSPEQETKLHTAPQASTRILTPQELKNGLGAIHSLPRLLIHEVVDRVSHFDLVSMTRTSRALNEVTLPRLYGHIFLASTRARLEAQAAVVERLDLLGRLAPTGLHVGAHGAVDQTLASAILNRVGRTVQQVSIHSAVAATQANFPVLPALPRLRSIQVGTSALNAVVGQQPLSKVLHPSTTTIESFKATGSFDPSAFMTPFPARMGIRDFQLARLLSTQVHLRDVVLLAGIALPGAPLPFAILNTPGAGPARCAALRTLVLGGQLLVKPPEAARFLQRTPNLEKLVLNLHGDVDSATPMLPKLEFLGGVAGSSLDLGALVAPGNQLTVLAMTGAMREEDMASYASRLCRLQPRGLSWSVTDMDGASSGRIFQLLKTASTSLAGLQKLRINDNGGFFLISSQGLLRLLAALSPHARSLESITLLQPMTDLSPQQQLAAATQFFSALPSLQMMRLLAFDQYSYRKYTRAQGKECSEGTCSSKEFWQTLTFDSELSGFDPTMMSG